MQNVFRGVGWMDSTTTMRIAMQNGADLNTKINRMGFPLCAGCAGNGRYGGVTACAVKDGDCEAFIHQTDVSGRRAQVS